MKKFLLFFTLGLTSQLATAKTTEQLIADINDIIDNHYASNDKDKTVKINAVIIAYKNFENQNEKDKVLQALGDIRGDFLRKSKKNYRNSVFVEASAIGVGTYALKKAIDSYYTLAPKSSLRSFSDWTGTAISASGMYAAGKFYANITEDSGALHRDIGKLAIALAFVPFTIAGAIKLRLATDNIIGLNPDIHAGKKTVVWLGLLAACPAICGYNALKGKKYYAQFQTANEIQTKLCYARNR